MPDAVAEMPTATLLLFDAVLPNPQATLPAPVARLPPLPRPAVWFSLQTKPCALAVRGIGRAARIAATIAQQSIHARSRVRRPALTCSQAGSNPAVLV
jgi:hypothetical protein